jgi:hypothetical protein
MCRAQLFFVVEVRSSLKKYSDADYGFQNVPSSIPFPVSLCHTNNGVHRTAFVGPSIIQQPNNAGTVLAQGDKDI